MIYLSVLVYLIFLSALYKVCPARGENSFFGFRNLTFALLFAELPYVMTVIQNHSVLHDAILENATDIELLIMQFLLFKAIFITFFSITAFFILPTTRNIVRMDRRNSLHSSNERRAPRFNLLLSMIFLTLTAVAFSMLVVEVGGILPLISGWSTKTELLMGTAAFRISNLVFGVLAIGFFIKYLSSKKSIGLVSTFFLLLIVMGVFLTLLAVGERKNPVLVVLFSIMLWDFQVHKVSPFSPRNIILFLLLSILASVFPDLRREGAFEEFVGNPSMFIDSIVNNWGQIFARVSDIDTSIFVYSHFGSLDTFWYGSTYPSVITGLIPSQFFPEKPPIDEGVYIYALAHGYSFSPPVPFRELIPVGWPLSRVTGPYVHFGVPGLIFGALLTGIVMRMIANQAFNSRSPAGVFIYAWAQLAGFGITNAFIFHLCTMLALLLPVHFVYNRIIRRRAIAHPRLLTT